MIKKIMLLFIIILSATSCRLNNNDQRYASNTKTIPIAEAKSLFGFTMDLFAKYIGDVNALHTNISNIQRIDIIRNVPVAEIMSAPGHLTLRNPKAVIDMAKIIENSADKGLAFIKGQEKIVLNIFTSFVSYAGETNPKVVIRSIEVIDGNHRLAAGLKAKKNATSVWNTIADIPPDALEIRVNGYKASNGDQLHRWIPSNIFKDPDCIGPCAEFKQGKFGFFKYIRDDRGGESVEIPGDISSIDKVIPAKFKGRPMREILQKSIELSY